MSTILMGREALAHTAVMRSGKATLADAAAGAAAKAGVAAAKAAAASKAAAALAAGAAAANPYDAAAAAAAAHLERYGVTGRVACVVRDGGRLAVAVKAVGGRFTVTASTTISA